MDRKNMRQLAAAMVVCCWLCTQQSSANTCACTPTLAAVNVTICIGSINYPMDVYFCDVNPTPDGTCTGAVQDRVSVLKKICFPSGRPPGLTDKQIISAMLCDMKNKACSVANQWGINVPNNSHYCWEIRSPRCTMTDQNGCIIACGNSPCCIIEMRWTRIAGNCDWDPRNIPLDVYKCSGTGTCNENCQDGDCPIPEGCCS